MKATSRRAALGAAALLSTALIAAGCTPVTVPTSTPGGPETTATAQPQTATTPRTRLALITDFGTCDEGEQWVADQVKAWDVDAIVTTGDNTQNEGCPPYSDTVWKYYDKGADGKGDPLFFPTLGNHDYSDPGAGLEAYRSAFPYLSTDADPQQRWYTETIGLTTIYSLNSESTAEELEAQRVWLSETLPAQKAAHPDNWNIVLFHKPAYTSGIHEPNRAMRPDAGFDYKAWGADIIISGHQHIYEDIVVDGMHYVTAGLGGTANFRECPAERREGSRLCLEGTGGMRIEATPRTLSLEYFQQGSVGQPKITDTIQLKRSSD